MRGRSSGKTGPPVPGLTRVGGGANKRDTGARRELLVLAHVTLRMDK